MRAYYVDAENVGLTIPESLPPGILDRVFVFTKSPSQIETCRNTCLTFVTGYPKGPNQADFAIMAHLGMLLGRLSPEEKSALQMVLCTRDKGLWAAFADQCQRAGVAAINPYLVADAEPIRPTGITPNCSPGTTCAVLPEPASSHTSANDSAAHTIKPADPLGPDQATRDLEQSIHLALKQPASKPTQDTLSDLESLPPMAREIFELIGEPTRVTDLHARFDCSYAQFLVNFNRLIEAGLICRSASARKKWVRSTRSNSPESRILRALDSSRMTCGELQQALGLTQSEFTAPFTRLIQQGKVVRCEEAQRMWRQATAS